MKQYNKLFSLKRVYDLTRMNFVGNKKLLLCIFLFFLTALLLNLVTARNPESEMSDYHVSGSFIFISIIVIMLYFTFFMEVISRRLHKSNTIAFVSIPATTLEKLLSIITTGALLLIKLWVVLQLGVVLIILIAPETADAFKTIGICLSDTNRVLILKPFTSILSFNSPAWLFIFTSIFTATITRWWFIGPLGLAFLYIWVDLYLINSIESSYTMVVGVGDALADLYVSGMWLANVLLFVGCYANLKRLQQIK